MPKQLPPKANLYEFHQLRRITGDTLRPGGLSITARALELCAFPEEARLLDVGCGAGASLAFLRERGFMPVGMDMSLPLLEEAQHFAPVLVADAENLPFRDAVFQGVFCECVVSLFQDAAQAFREIGRVLAPGGWLVVSDMIRLGTSACSGYAEAASFRLQERTAQGLQPEENISAAPDRTRSLRVQPKGSRTLTANTCLQGAKSRKEMENLFAGAGFAVRHVIDYRKALVAMSAKMVWEFGSIEAFWELWRCHSANVSHESHGFQEFQEFHGCQTASCPKSLGYELFIGQKLER